ncbi:hypothetical protein BS78_06G198600 [Paspalum vaginatum]|nr:hypothetical protein BS78_06G198600 [Paspalum vaginatum]
MSISSKASREKWVAPLGQESMECSASLPTSTHQWPWLVATGWADLPDDLLDMVAKRTPGIKDYVRLRAVCKSWLSFLRPESMPPLLMLPYDPRGESCTRPILDVSDGTVHELDLPETRGYRCCGSSHGWFVLERWPDLWLLSTRPRGSAFSSRSCAPRRGVVLRSLHAEGRQGEVGGPRLPQPAPPAVRAGGAKGGLQVLSSDPSVDGNCTVMVLLATEEVVFCNPTDASWRTLAFAPGAFSDIDVTYQNGAFHLVSPLREMPTRRDAVHALAHTWDGQCLVQRRGGELLMAAWSGGGRELAVLRLRSDGWWTAAEAGDDVVFLASADSGGLAFGMATCVDGKGLMFDSSKLTSLPCFLTTNANAASSVCSVKETEVQR